MWHIHKWGPWITFKHSEWSIYTWQHSECLICNKRRERRAS